MLWPALEDLDTVALNFLIDPHTRLGVDLRESDYAQLTSINDRARYLGNKLPP